MDINNKSHPENQEIKQDNKKDKEKIEDEKIISDELKNLVSMDLMKEEFEELDFDLPPFDSLAEDFDIEKAFDKDSSFLLREIRKTIMEKLSAYLQLFETFMNPSSPPMFVFSALRNLDDSNREQIKDLYKNLSKYQLWSVKLDTIYNEEKEAEFIKISFNEWQDYKKEIYKLIEKLETENNGKEEYLKGGYFN